MKKICMLTLLVLLLFASAALAQTSSVASGVSNVGIVSNPSINQQFQAADPGQGRWFIPPVQPYQAPVMPYLGPWSSGSNIIEDLRVLPEVITLDQARKMYQGGVSARINRMADFSYQFETCKLMQSLPAKPLLNSKGEPVYDKSGNMVMVPDESKFKRVAYIFLQGDEKANTVDVIARATLEAMKLGATGIVLVKKVTSTATRSTGWGIGIGGVMGQLTGTGQTNSQAASSGTGFNRATAEPIYKEGIIVLAVQE